MKRLYSLAIYSSQEHEHDNSVMHSLFSQAAFLATPVGRSDEPDGALPDQVLNRRVLEDVLAARLHLDLLVAVLHRRVLEQDAAHRLLRAGKDGGLRVARRQRRLGGRLGRLPKVAGHVLQRERLEVRLQVGLVRLGEGGLFPAQQLGVEGPDLRLNLGEAEPQVRRHQEPVGTKVQLPRPGRMHASTRAHPPDPGHFHLVQWDPEVGPAHFLGEVIFQPRELVHEAIEHLGGGRQ